MLIAQAKITDEEAPSLIVTPEEARREAATGRSGKSKESKKPSTKKEPTP
jgi:hypothetical protein